MRNRNLAFAQVCRACRKSRPIEDFRSPSHHKINKTCRECLDAKAKGEPPATGGLGIYLPVVIPPEDRRQRRWWPEWVHAEDPTVRLNPRGSGELRTCPQCGTEFTSKNNLQRFCRSRCKGAWHRTKRVDKAREAATVQ